MGGHLIDRVKFDVEAENTAEAKEIQDKIFSICRYQLDAALDATLAEDEDALMFREEQLVLDLGYIPKDALDNQLIPRILEEFLAAISDWEMKQMNEDISTRDLEALTLFLEKGVRHWSKGNNYNPLDEISNVIKNRWSYFLKFLKKTPFKRQVSSRIVSLVSIQNYQALIQKLRPTESDFILSFTEATINMVDRPESVSIPKSKWAESLRVLVLHDLIKNHDSLFNRKMFVHRQLLALSAEHNVSYLDLLNELDAVLSDIERSYRYHTSLPFLIQDLSKEVRTGDIDNPVETKLAAWNILFKPEDWEASHVAMLHHHWKRWITQYPGEMKKSFEDEVRTVDQVEFLVQTLQDEQIDDVIEVLLPNLSRYVIRYKQSVIKGNKDSNTLTTTEDNLRSTLNFLIISYLTLDMGTTFNKKEFFTQQIIRLSRHYNLKYKRVIAFLFDALDSSKEPILFGMLELIRQINESMTSKPAETAGPVFEVQDELELLFFYLRHGRLHSEMKLVNSNRPFDFLAHILISERHKGLVLDFIHSHKNEIANKVSVYDFKVFLQLTKLLLSTKIQLPANEVKIIFNQIKKHSKQAVDQGKYRSFIFLFLISLKRKLQTKDVREYDLDRTPDPHSLLCRYLIIKLSLSEFYNEESYSAKPTAIDGIKPINYQGAKDQLFAAIDHLLIGGQTQEYQKNQLNVSFRKILESKQESEALLNALNTPQVLLLFKHGNKLARYRLLKLISLRSRLIQVLLDELKIDTIDDGELKGWEDLIALDSGYHTDQLESRLKTVLLSMKLSNAQMKAILEKVEDIATGRSERKNIDIGRLVDFFSSGKLLKNWTIPQIEHLFIAQYNGNYNELSLALRSIIADEKLLNQLHRQLGKHVLVRWMQMLAGSEFTTLNNQIEKLEKLLFALVESGVLKSDNKNELERIKIHFLYAYQFRKPNLELMVRYYVRYLAKLESLKYTELAESIYRGMTTLEDESPAEQVVVIKRIKKILASKTDLSEPKEDLNERTIDADGNYKIENAGLIITWPFIKNLFNQLAYLDESGAFKSTEEKSRAVKLLQYVSTGDTDQPEYQMTLNKLLCGYPLVEPLVKGVELSEKEKNLADSMLEGVISNWDKLGGTSIEGLRSTFLLRNGSLNLEETNWILRIEKKGTDVLLDFLPWSIASIKLPWYEGMIYVEWR